MSSAPSDGSNRLTAVPLTSIYAVVNSADTGDDAITFTSSPAELYASIVRIYGYGIGVGVTVGDGVCVGVAV
jgi:hypothetical protein